MSTSFVFWLCMFLWLIFGICPGFPGTIAAGQPRTPYYTFGGTLLLFIVICLLGWHDFGAPLQNH